MCPQHDFVQSRAGNEVRPGAQIGAPGPDRNAEPATDRDGTVYRLPDTSAPGPKISRHRRRTARQRKGSHRRQRTGRKLRRLQRKRSRRRSVACHVHGRTIAAENLNTKAMTRVLGRPAARPEPGDPGDDLAARSPGWRRRHRHGLMDRWAVGSRRMQPVAPLPRVRHLVRGPVQVAVHRHWRVP